ncbi:glycerol-3-phosphate dehydrogenase [NAD(+)] 1, chloroplastic-like [Arachis ipaensis]|uniref:glycerol-3-phosphate dehydrogenase [NAD(+)] 1, chloroplastic-like n=1 Tax=Arachis ipaensis TaxID=130454 RepID=UPI000A2B72ED|nr:glycerol-3-phosphate dehydrogenase [NAD(+)] 1, chloroplastic-like [Arachis ipaensis]
MVIEQFNLIRLWVVIFILRIYIGNFIAYVVLELEGYHCDLTEPVFHCAFSSSLITQIDPMKNKVTVVGSGNWGSVAAKLIASNTVRLSSFDDEVRMWVFEEKLPSGEKLTDVINRTNENVKYLPGIKLGKNVVADPDVESAVKGANMLVFIALEKFSEATVGYSKNKEAAEKWVQLFGTPYFIVSAVQDVEGVEMCGTLKNIVAIAAGFVDGMEMGNNTKAAIMRIGLKEMIKFSKMLFPSVKDSTFFESCGVADLITTCLGGRNRKVADAYAKNQGKRSFDQLEAELLNGQKLQGVLTAKEVYEVLSDRGWVEQFPLFSTVHAISIGRLPPSAIVELGDSKSANKQCK